MKKQHYADTVFYQKHGYEIVDNRTVKLGEKDYPLTVFRKKNWKD
jgi:hypothetical protein